MTASGRVCQSKDAACPCGHQGRQIDAKSPKPTFDEVEF